MLRHNVRLLRKLLGLTQEQLAEKIKSKKSYIWDIENKPSNPSITIVNALAKALNVSIDDLVNTDCSNYEVEPQTVRLVRNTGDSMSIKIGNEYSYENARWIVVAIDHATALVKIESNDAKKWVRAELLADKGKGNNEN